MDISEFKSLHLASHSLPNFPKMSLSISYLERKEFDVYKFNDHKTALNHIKANGYPAKWSEVREMNGALTLELLY